MLSKLKHIKLEKKKNSSTILLYRFSHKCFATKQLGQIKFLIPIFTKDETKLVGFEYFFKQLKNIFDLPNQYLKNKKQTNI